MGTNKRKGRKVRQHRGTKNLFGSNGAPRTSQVVPDANGVVERQQREEEVAPDRNGDCNAPCVRTRRSAQGDRGNDPQPSQRPRQRPHIPAGIETPSVPAKLPASRQAQQSNGLGSDAIDERGLGRPQRSSRSGPTSHTAADGVVNTIRPPGKPPRKPSLNTLSPRQQARPTTTLQIESRPTSTSPALQSGSYEVPARGKRRRMQSSSALERPAPGECLLPSSSSTPQVVASTTGPDQQLSSPEPYTSLQQHHEASAKHTRQPSLPSRQPICLPSLNAVTQDSDHRSLEAHDSLAPRSRQDAHGDVTLPASTPIAPRIVRGRRAPVAPLPSLPTNGTASRERVTRPGPVGRCIPLASNGPSHEYESSDAESSAPHASTPQSPKKTISLRKYNMMKAEIAASKRVSMELCAALRSEREKSERYKAEANKAKVNADYLSSGPTPAASRSGSVTSQLSWQNFGTSNDAVLGVRKGTSAKRKLYQELSDKDIPHTLVSPFDDFVENMTTYAHMYTAEVCYARWASFTSNTEWAPNYIVQSDRIIRDYRGRVITNKHFQSCVVQNEEDLASISVPLLHVVKKPFPDSSESIQRFQTIVESSFFPACPVQESRRGTTFTSSSASLANFVGQCVVSTLRDKLTSAPTKEVERSAFSFATECKQLMKMFRSSCNKAVSTRKKASKDAFFGMLGYKYIIANKPRGVNDTFDRMRAAEMREAYVKMFKVDNNGERDTTLWRTAAFQDICHSSLHGKPLALHGLGCTDNLFGNEPARTAFWQFVKYRKTNEDDSSCMSVIRLDAIVTAIVDSFESVSATTGILDEDVNVESTAGNESPPSGRALPSIAKKAIVTKGGTIPIESQRRYKRTLVFAAVRFMRDALQYLTEGIQRDPDQLKLETSMCSGTTEGECLNNDFRLHTLAFKYPHTGHYYVALTSVAFSEFVCGWLGNVCDCYILRSGGLGTPFSPFDCSDNLDVVNESDEEVREDPRHQSAIEMHAAAELSEGIDGNNALRLVDEEADVSGEEEDI